ncbi:CLUMA_CG011177, isoform A [Clunio marinus]|uniref:CLUMA_CG011177, isoform A n=1 Tax=Clunio marinus TaxID=568069 RepID=A0A1J1IFL3_9DIPT|nr:CLUMA_CG011177, isoform A [Clunio marinus]
MPPRRIKSNSLRSEKIGATSPMKLESKQTNHEIKDGQKETDLSQELKFDKELLWCISQFDKQIKSGNLSKAKEQESLKAIRILRKQSNSKIQKIALMKQYFKDYKSKMQKEEEFLEKEAKTVFLKDAACNINKGIFVKKKVLNSNHRECENKNTFLFNFNSTLSDDLNKINEKLETIKL